MMKQILFHILALSILGNVIYFTVFWISPPAPMTTEASLPGGACTALCLDNGDYCVFGANQDNSLEMGLVFVNKRNVLKTTWDPSTSGEYARWISRYGSVTINFVGYQMAWAGMNEAGLMLSTMSLAETRGPTPDERPPFNGPFWMQYQLDNHSTVEQVIASFAENRVAESTVDHYLVCDRSGACTTIEFIAGELVYHTGEGLPVAALTNSTYENSVSAWDKSLMGQSLPDDNSLWRFTTAANKLVAFVPNSSEEAVEYAFDTLAAVSREDTVWSFVFDPLNLRVHFRTNHNPRIRYVDFSDLDFSCRTPVRLVDVHANRSGNINADLVAYTHAASFAHSASFFNQFEGLNQPPFVVDTLLWGLESFPCQEGKVSTQANLQRFRSPLPPAVTWAGLTILHRVAPFWIPMVMLSLAFVIWRMALDQRLFPRRRLAWALAILLLGPFGLLAYLLARRRKRHVMIQ